MSLVVCLFAFLFFKPGRIVFSFTYAGFQKMKTKPIKILSDKKKKSLHESHMITIIWNITLF